jgi:hypothetical protein
MWQTANHYGMLSVKLYVMHSVKNNGVNANEHVVMHSLKYYVMHSVKNTVMNANKQYVMHADKHDVMYSLKYYVMQSSYSIQLTRNRSLELPLIQYSIVCFRFIIFRS